MLAIGSRRPPAETPAAVHARGGGDEAGLVELEPRLLRLANRELASRQTYLIGPDGKILHIDNAVKPASSGPDMVARLAELKIDKKK